MLPDFDLTKIGETACFTGPRPKNLFGYYDSMAYAKIMDRVGAIIPMLVQAGTKTFISGGAQGFDQLAFHTVECYGRKLGVENVVYVPFLGQETRWAETGLFGQAQYRQMLDKASYVRTLSDTPPKDYWDAPRMLHERNHAMVEDSDYVIALLADRSLDWRTAKGGTAECVRYAVSKCKPVLAFRINGTEISGPEWEYA